MAGSCATSKVTARENAPSGTALPVWVPSAIRTVRPADCSVFASIRASVDLPTPMPPTSATPWHSGSLSAASARRNSASRATMGHVQPLSRCTGRRPSQPTEAASGGPALQQSHGASPEGKALNHKRVGDCRRKLRCRSTAPATSHGSEQFPPIRRRPLLEPTSIVWFHGRATTRRPEIGPCHPVPLTHAQFRRHAALMGTPTHPSCTPDVAYSTSRSVLRVYRK